MGLAVDVTLRRERHGPPTGASRNRPVPSLAAGLRCADEKGQAPRGGRRAGRMPSRIPSGQSSPVHGRFSTSRSAGRGPVLPSTCRGARPGRARRRPSTRRRIGLLELAEAGAWRRYDAPVGDEASASAGVSRSSPGNTSSSAASLRDEQNRLPCHLRRCRSDSAGASPGLFSLLGQAVQHPLSYRQFVALTPDWASCSCLVNYSARGAQFAPACGEPQPLLHPPQPPAISWRASLLTDRRRLPAVGAAEPGKPPPAPEVRGTPYG
ncbi:hypothetical protein FHS41_000635 [Streptomyces violarus]|uniref:Uncharacterized protein n=1 Tax=Streptomyces violarus TaxID=67380 RepID=A0A7W4ZKP4_9ACTN|nr:hypothetical protein [Streptomyces violarus]